MENILTPKTSELSKLYQCTTFLIILCTLLIEMKTLRKREALESQLHRKGKENLNIRQTCSKSFKELKDAIVMKRRQKQIEKKYSHTRNTYNKKVFVVNACYVITRNFVKYLMQWRIAKKSKTLKYSCALLKSCLRVVVCYISLPNA